MDLTLRADGTTIESIMRAFRARLSVVTSIALWWQLLAVTVVPTALCCLAGSAAPAAAMADCPIHNAAAATAEPACPLHMEHGATAHDCDCPRLGCSQTDHGFMALFGPIAVLTAPAAAPAPHLAGDAVSVIPPSSASLPGSCRPPPRSSLGPIGAVTQLIAFALCGALPIHRAFTGAFGCARAERES